MCKMETILQTFYHWPKVIINPLIPPQMNQEQLKDRLKANGLEKYFDKFQSVSRNAIRLYPKQVMEDDIAIGQTKIGGKPDFPSEITWVTEPNIIETEGKASFIFKNNEKGIVRKSLSFIAQINLSETAPFDSENLLPKTGILYFFYSAEQEAWGFAPTDKDSFRVFYWNGDFAELKRIDFPTDLPEHSCFKPCLVEISSEVSLPSYDHEVYNDFEDGEDDRFWENVHDNGSINKMLGYSDNIQNPMELECELVTNGIYTGDPSGYNDPRVKALEPNAKDWRLLLQIASNEENEMMWGDCGRLYFWIKKQDLLNKQFEKSWFSFQCY